jgi:hypothetical protein
MRVAHPHRGLTLLTIEEIPQHVWYEQQQQQEIFFISEFHLYINKQIHIIYNIQPEQECHDTARPEQRLDGDAVGACLLVVL